MTMQDLWKTLDAQLTQEERKGPVTSLGDYHERREARRQIEQRLTSLSTTMNQVKQRFQRLSALPAQHTVLWAQAVLGLENLAFLEVDTDGVGNDARLLRVLTLNKQGQVLFDTFIKPTRTMTAQDLYYTGIRPQELDEAPTLEEAWPSLTNALQGNYLLSWFLEFDAGKLHANAGRFHLPAPIFIGECLMQKSTQYFHLHQQPKLTTLCRQLGQPLPDLPQQTAVHRALGQLHLLEAMAQGMTSVASPPSVDELLTEETFDDNDLDGHPF